MTDLMEALEKICPEVDPAVREDFLSRMDPEYFSLYSPDEIGLHLRMSCRLAPQHPVQVHVAPRGQGEYNIAVVAYDYFSEFSVICGMLAAFGLDIRSGRVYTLDAAKEAPVKTRRRGPAKRGMGRSRIVDLFRVASGRGGAFDPARQREFMEETEALIVLLDQDRLEEARARVSRRVARYLSKTQEAWAVRLYPVQVKFDNALSEKWTVMEIHSEDTPAFLYAFSNALSLRGVYIHRVVIENTQGKVSDRFFLADRQGRKIEDPKDQALLRAATALIKQFTYFLPRAPDPARAVQYFDQMLDKVMERGAPGPILSFLEDRGSMDLLARLLGTSDFLWKDFLRMQFESLLPVLQSFKKTDLLVNSQKLRRQLKKSLERAKNPEEEKRILNEYKDREMFRIDMRHLLEPPGDLMDFSKALTELAEVVLEQAYEVCDRRLKKLHGRPLLENGRVCPMAVFGLGKFGGREMGYASDIEVLFVYGGSGRTEGKKSMGNGEYFERLVQDVVDLIEARREGIFQLDLRLRPYGKAGAFATPLEQFRTYYRTGGDAAPFERQALTKLRWIAGDEALGRQVEDLRDRFVYSGAPWDLPTALHLRRRQMKELVPSGRVSIKYSQGGVIDIEYFVQYLQVMHGHRLREIRQTSTLDALEALRRAGIVSPEERDQLRRSYLFLRALIDALRIVRGNAKDLVLPEEGSEEYKFLARRMGYLSGDWEADARRLGEDIRRHMKTAHGFFAARFEPE